MAMDVKENKNKTNGLAAGIAIGAALGAAAVALQDKKNQEKVTETVKKVKNWAEKTTGQIADRSDDAIKEAKIELEGMKKEIKEPKVQ